MQSLTASEMDEVKEIFYICSHDNDVVPVSQLGTMFHALGFELESSEVEECLATTIGFEVNVDGDQISFHQFVYIVTPFIRNRSPEEEADLLFELFDEDQTGLISFENLKKLSLDVGLDISDETLQEMILEADHCGNDSLCREDFREIMRHNI